MHSGGSLSLLSFLLQFNFTHTIHRLSFGEDYPGQVNPLDNFNVVAEEEVATGNTCIPSHKLVLVVGLSPIRWSHVSILCESGSNCL